MERELTIQEIHEIAPDFRRAQEFCRDHLNVEIEMRCWENIETGMWRWVYSVYGHAEHREYVLEKLREASDILGLAGTPPRPGAPEEE